jgi:predicted aspartyl protease
MAHFHIIHYIMTHYLLRIATPLLAVVLLASEAQKSEAQDGVPVIKANSTTVDIQDGHNFRKGHWTVEPNLKIDTYYPQRSRTAKTVTFRTDIDSISFEVDSGHDYDFVILLNGKNSCRTRISAMRRSCTMGGSYDLTNPAEIPFTLTGDNQIRLEARVNGSSPLVLLFDTGADTTVLYRSSLTKGAKPEFDDTILNAADGGMTRRQTSKDNRLEIAGLNWEHEQVIFAEKLGRATDGILGFNVFEDRIVEIDYERKLLRIRDSLPSTMEGYHRGELRFHGTSPFVEATLDIGSTKVKDWFLLDTGFNGSLSLTRDFYVRNGLSGSPSVGVRKDGARSELFNIPGLMLGNVGMRAIPTNVDMKPTGNQQSTGLLGMDVLKRFNTLLDYRINVIYLKPNSLIDTPFRQPSGWIIPVILAGAVLHCAGAAVLLVMRRSPKATKDSEITPAEL